MHGAKVKTRLFINLVHSINSWKAEKTYLVFYNMLK